MAHSEQPHLGHIDGLADDGVKRFRKPPDWFVSVRPGRGAINAILAVTTGSMPAPGETIEVAGVRYIVRDIHRADIPHQPAWMHPDEYHVDVLLEEESS